MVGEEGMREEGKDGMEGGEWDVGWEEEWGEWEGAHGEGV